MIEILYIGCRYSEKKQYWIGILEYAEEGVNYYYAFGTPGNLKFFRCSNHKQKGIYGQILEKRKTERKYRFSFSTTNYKSYYRELRQGGHPELVSEVGQYFTFKKLKDV